MGRKTRPKSTTPGSQRAPLANLASPSSSSAQSRLKHRWLARFAAAVLIPALVLGGIEAALRVFNYGYSTSFFEPAGDGRTMTTNQKFAWQFYSRGKATSPTPVLFPKEKAPGTFRVFVLGESAAAGTPDPAFSFSRMLELMLSDQYPGRGFEIINAAMRGVDSHIIRQIARECAGLSPDLFIIYMGNNEMIGLHAPSPDEFDFTSNLHWQRIQHAIKRTKLAQLGESILLRLSKNRSAPKQDMEFFRRQRLAFDDPRKDAVYRSFAINLADICSRAVSAQAQAIVCSVGVNLRDFPPLGSLHRRDLIAERQREWEQFFAAGIGAESRQDFQTALASYQNAARIDDHFAELLFRMARCQEALGNLDEARRHYALARDRDAMQFRTDGRLNEMARSVATNANPNVRFVDMERQFAASALAQNGIPGKGLFQEHVHFTFDGDYQMASSLLPAVAAALKLPAPSQATLSRIECARRLAYTPVDEMNVQAAMVQLTGNPPFLDQAEHATRQAAAGAEARRRLQQTTGRDFDQAAPVYQQAIRARPDDWMLHYNFANLLSQFGQTRAALAEYAEVVKRLPAQRAFRVTYGNALLQTGQADEAAAQFEAALKIDPEFQPAQQGLQATRRGAR